MRLRREALGMTLADLAGHLSVQLAALSKVERGRSRVSLDLAAEIAGALDTTVGMLLDSAAQIADHPSK